MHFAPACAALLLAGATATCQAQQPSDRLAPATPQAASAAAAASAAGPSRAMKQVIEDDRVRIEETRLRGEAQRITVHSKIPGVRDYDILLPPAGKDPSQDRGAAGKRTWSIFDF
jgi:hypothetical protein